MAASLNHDCTPLKRKYDACFNEWFPDYLRLATSAPAHSDLVQKKAQEYEQKCGAVFEEYQACLTKALQARDLDSMLSQARTDEPLSEHGAEFESSK